MNFAPIIMMIALGVILPAAVSIVWLVKTHEKVTTLLAGAATWFVFAILLESIPKAILFNPALSIGKAVTENIALYVICGTLLAGIFEETGRLVVFQTLLRKQKHREAGLTHGIGHGAMEAFFVMAVSGVEYLIFAILIETGAFQSLIDSVASQGADVVASLEILPAQIASLTPLTVLLQLLERVFAMLLHAGLSIMVFYAVPRKKLWLYPFAILLHALFDLPAALYQTGVIGLYLTEGLLALYALLFFFAVYYLLYRKDPGAPKDEFSQP